MNAIDIIINGSMKAAANLMGKFPKVSQYDGRHDLVCGALRGELKVMLPVFMREWKEATAANLSEGWLREMMNEQCHRVALNALRICEEEL